MAGFDNPWYADMIARFTPLVAPGDRADAGHIAVAILAGFSILAQAVDLLDLQVDRQ